MRRIDQAAFAHAWQTCDVFIESRDLKRDRPRIVGIENDQISDWRQQQPDEITGPVRDLAIDQRQQQIEILTCRGVGRNCRAKRVVLIALDSAPHFEEPPAGGAVHILLRQTGEGCERLQGQLRGLKQRLVVLGLFR